MKPKQLVLWLCLAAAMVGGTAPAHAHVGVGAVHSFSHGFMHPFSGIDHLLAMISVGIIATAIGGRVLFLVPAAFIAMMGFGGLLGLNQIPVPSFELGIAASLCVFGAIVAMRWQLPTFLAMATVGVFAVFHGYAHGAEMPDLASGSKYAAGFLLASASLHAIGIFAGLWLSRLRTNQMYERARAIAGTAVAFVGVMLLAT